MKKLKLTSLVLASAVLIGLSGCNANPGATTASQAPETTVATEQTVPDNTGDEFVSAYPAFAVTSESLTGGLWNEITSNTVEGKNLSPELSWDAVEGASCYVIYMVDMNTHYFLHWKMENITETKLSEGAASSKEYIGMYPPPGVAHQYNVYVFALKNPVERAKGSINGINPKTADFMAALDTDKDGNTGNIIAVGRICGNFVGK